MRADTGNSLGGDFSILSALVGAGGVLLAPVMHLYKGSLFPTKDTPLATFVAAEADFTGYTAVSAITWSTVILSSSGIMTAVSMRCLFKATADAPTNSIGGAWLEATAGGLLEFFPFPQPVVIALTNNFVAVTIYQQYPTPGYAEIES